jgi:hypothetical protein
MTKGAWILLAAAWALGAQEPGDARDVLQRARQQILNTMRRLPKYTCLETINRTYYAPPAATKTSKAKCAPGDGGGAKTALRLSASDRVRVEVAEGDSREIYSWPGASHFENGPIEEMVSRGPVASGAFGGYLIDVFATEGTHFDFVTERMEKSRRILTYAYQVPLKESKYKVAADIGWVMTAYKGEIDLDAGSLELLRVTVNTTPELPVETGLCTARSELQYSRVRIGDGDFLLPNVSRLYLANRSGTASETQSEFAACKEYVAESVLHIEGEDDAPAKGADAAVETRAALPDGVRLALRLDAAIDTDSAAAGDAITAAVTSAVRDPKSNAVLFPQGAVAHGRINRMEHWMTQSPRFVIGIEWEYVSHGKSAAPLSAILDASGNFMAAPNPAVTELSGRTPPGLGTIQRRPQALGLPDAFTIPSTAKHYVLPAKYAMHWVTVKAAGK